MASSGRLARCPESKVARSLNEMKNADNDVQYCLLRHFKSRHKRITSCKYTKRIHRDASLCLHRKVAGIRNSVLT